MHTSYMSAEVYNMHTVCAIILQEWKRFADICSEKYLRWNQNLKERNLHLQNLNQSLKGASVTTESKD